MFENFAGNEYFKNTVKKMAESERFVHSIILEGPDGIGKHKAAGIISAAAVCEENNPPCEKCRKCRLAMSLSLADISVYSPEKTVFSIKTVREKIRVDAYIKPIESKRKVFVLEHAELMSAEAQNAMLKILEEPPDSVIFILLTTSAALLLPTIRSRCLTLTLREPETDRAFTYIKQNSEYHDEEIKTALESTDNNIGAALSLLGDNAENSTKLSALEIYRSFSLTKLDLLRAFEKEIGGNRTSAKQVLSELKNLIMKEIKQQSGNADSLVRVMPFLENAIGYINSNCSISLALTVLASDIFSTIQGTRA